jgi:predicted acylesterase/phospholipase RssA
MAEFDIVFEGGGIKGAAFAGAVAVLEERRHTPRRLVGTSVGAITAACLAAGYKKQELLDLVQERSDGKLVFASFVTPPEPEDYPLTKRRFVKKLLQNVNKGLESKTANVLLDLATLIHPHLDEDRIKLYVPHLLSLFQFGALCRDREFVRWLEAKLGDKVPGFSEKTTLQQFHRQIGKDLSLTATDTSDKELLVLNHRTAPNCPVVRAVQMSMTIPFVWPEIVWQPAWDPYGVGRNARSKAGNLIVDGGVLSNFPLRLLLEKKQAPVTGQDTVGEVMGDDGARALKLGLLLDETRPAPGTDVEQEKKHMLGKLKAVQTLSRLIETMTGAWDEQAIEQYRDHICRIGVKGFGALDLDMEPFRLDQLINSGRCAMTTHLEGLRKLGRI